MSCSIIGRGSGLRRNVRRVGESWEEREEFAGLVACLMESPRGLRMGIRGRVGQRAGLHLVRGASPRGRRLLTLRGVRSRGLATYDLPKDPDLPSDNFELASRFGGYVLQILLRSDPLVACTKLQLPPFPQLELPESPTQRVLPKCLSRRRTNYGLEWQRLTSY